ncbi:MAG TPA: peptidyl-prolyl cis-trans isomerase [Bryobacteraceae bacterium]|nr:peptidyl-prolyl cis-trans isomerase [Bryobacteraceae bacterium]
MRFRSLIPALALTLGTLFAQDANQQLVQRLKSQPVARVNGTVLTQGDLLREMYTIFPYARTHNGFPKAMESDIRVGAMKMIEFEELVYQDARRRGLTITPAKLDRAMADFKAEFSAEEYKAYLTGEMGGSLDKLRAQIRRSMLIDLALKMQVTDRAVTTLAEAKIYYDQNPNEFRIPESYAVQTISIFPPNNAKPSQLKETVKRANDALLRAKATKTYNDFGLLAEQLSDDDYRVNMGDHHAVDRAKLPPDLVPAILSMKPGQMSGLIQVGQAFCIVRLNSHIPQGMKSFAEVKDDLRGRLEKKKTEQLRQALNRRLRAAAKVEEL